MDKKKTPLQRTYQKALQEEKLKLQAKYQRDLAQFAEDAIKTIRALEKSLEAEDRKALLEAIELDWADLQRLKDALR